MLTVTCPVGLSGDLGSFPISERAAATRVRSLHPYLSQRHKRTETAKEISAESRKIVEDLTLFQLEIVAFHANRSPTPSNFS